MAKIECGVFHPDSVDLACRLPPGNHPAHLAGYAPNVLMWPNDDYVSPHKGDPTHLFEKAAQRIPPTRPIPLMSPYLHVEEG